MNENLNKNDELRQKIIGIDDYYLFNGMRRSEDGTYDTFSFENLSLGKLKKLIDNNFIDLNEHQHNSPTVKEYLDLLEKYKDERVMLHGYIVTPDRDDYRVSIEGLKCHSRNIDFIAEYAELCHLADEFECKNGYQRCWYD